MLNYLSYLQDKDDNSIVKQSLPKSIEPYNGGQNSSYWNLVKMSEYFNLYGFNYNSLSDSACAFSEQKKSGHYRRIFV